MASGGLEEKIQIILSTAQGLAFLSLHGSLFKFVFYLTMIQMNQIIFERCVLEIQNKTWNEGCFFASALEYLC